MAVITERFVVLHVPKTGGTWIQSVLERIYSYLNCPGPLTIDRGHHTQPVPPSKLADRTVLYGVRHPVSWLRSYYLHQQRAGFQADFSPMPHARQLLQLSRDAGSCRRFLEMVAVSGTIVSDVWRGYTDPYPDAQLFQLRREQLCSGLIHGLITAGVWPEERRHEITDLMCLCEPGRAAGAMPSIGLGLCEKLAKSDERAFRIGGYR